MPFNFTVIQSGVLYLKVKHSKGKNKAGTGVSCSFNLQVSQMDLRGPNKGDKKERTMKTLYVLMLPTAAACSHALGTTTHLESLVSGEYRQAIEEGVFVKPFLL